MLKNIPLVTQINPYDVNKTSTIVRNPRHPIVGIFNCASDVHPEILIPIKNFLIRPSLRDMSIRLQELMGALEKVYPFVREFNIEKTYEFSDMISYSIVGQVEFYNTVDLYNWEINEGMGYKGFSYMSSHELKICIDQMMRDLHSMSVDSHEYIDMRLLINLTRVRYEAKYLQEKEHSPFVKPVV